MTHLEEVLKIASSKALHLGCVVRKPTDGLLPKWSDLAKPAMPSNPRRLVPFPGEQGRPLPSVKLVDRLCRVGGKNAEYMDEKGLPHPKLKLMQLVDREE